MFLFNILLITSSNFFSANIAFFNSIFPMITFLKFLAILIFFLHLLTFLKIFYMYKLIAWHALLSKCMKCNSSFATMKCNISHIYQITKIDNNSLIFKDLCENGATHEDLNIHVSFLTIRFWYIYIYGCPQMNITNLLIWYLLARTKY